MKHLAFFDDVTKLPNKRSFLYEVKQRCRQGDQKKNKFAIIKLRINRVTHLKDLFGQDTIDKMMRTLAENLSQSLKRSAFVSRIEEDKFGIIFSIQNGELLARMEDVYKCVPEKIVIDNQEIKVDFHSGIAIYPNDGENAEELMRNCKYALLIADEEKVNFLQYDPQKSNQIKRKIEIEKELYKAMTEHQFELYYQPQYDVVKHKIVGAEALIRWFHPHLGAISPAEFIPIAESNGLIIEIGKWVIEEGCKQLKKWHGQGYKEMKLSLNLSVRQLYQNNIVEMINHTLKQLNLTQDSLVFEFTESSMMHDIDLFIQVISKFKSRGFHISIDDFGTGYSSLYYLTRLQIDSIKIDRSFIQNMEYSKENEMVITSIISLAKNLQLQFIAEGVESISQVTLLKEMNCELIQGYYISKPIPAEKFEYLLQQRINV
nr:bifunctional diguanylate cyclase/phosphodiesterase [Metabacillus litoralis]